MDPKIKQKVNRFFRKYKHKIYKRGSCLIRSGETPRGVFCLQKGIVRSVGLLNHGGETTINLFKPISFFPMNWVINNKLELYSFEALTDVEVYIASKREFGSFLKENSEVLFDLVKRVYRGLEGYQLRIESLLSNNDNFKVLVQILISARRFGEKDQEEGYVVKLSKNEMASLTGLSENKVVRIMRALDKRRLIKYGDDTFVVRNINHLESETFLS